ncbi:hypothetical protein NDU88_005495 [Pleurodeles waltl]|uniref:Uncharacterized protein n=1 Tax=Pleurodeles waltl TaxID=8319 RepID=A0AAV7UM13_PLEWA|nr:hypothetical protein NDU88_005495 [Pleurodeles waltl]
MTVTKACYQRGVAQDVVGVCSSSSPLQSASTSNRVWDQHQCSYRPGWRQESSVHEGGMGECPRSSGSRHVAGALSVEGEEVAGPPSPCGEVSLFNARGAHCAQCKVRRAPLVRTQVGSKFYHCLPPPLLTSFMGGTRGAAPSRGLTSVLSPGLTAQSRSSAMVVARRCALPGSPLCKFQIVCLLHSLLLFPPALSGRRSYEVASGRTSPLMMYARAGQSPEDPRDRRCSGCVGANM